MGADLAPLVAVPSPRSHVSSCQLCGLIFIVALNRTELS